MKTFNKEVKTIGETAAQKNYNKGWFNCRCTKYSFTNLIGEYKWEQEKKI